LILGGSKAAGGVTARTENPYFLLYAAIFAHSAVPRWARAGLCAPNCWPHTPGRARTDRLLQEVGVFSQTIGEASQAPLAPTAYGWRSYTRRWPIGFCVGSSPATALKYSSCVADKQLAPTSIQRN